MIFPSSILINSVCIFKYYAVTGADDDTPVLIQYILFNKIYESSSSVPIEGSRGLVKDHDIGTTGERPCDGNPLLLPPLSASENIERLYLDHLPYPDIT